MVGWTAPSATIATTVRLGQHQRKLVLPPHVQRVIQESTKTQKEKQHVFPVCLASTSVLIELTARNVPLKRIKTKLLSPVVNLVLLDASRRWMEARHAWLAWLENLKRK